MGTIRILKRCVRLRGAIGALLLLHIFFPCVSPCLFVGVCMLQRQQQNAAGEDQKNGEDFAESF
jgi:hypothetical protein